MAMTADYFEPAREEEIEDLPEDSGARVQPDPALKQLLERPDDRLLKDVGLSRDSAFAEVARFWREWSRRRDPWHL